MLQFSTGLRQALLTTGDFKAQMDGGFIHIYGWGTASAIPGRDDAIDTTPTTGDYILLATISASGGTNVTGLNFAEPVDGVVSKDAGQTWNNSTTENLATGTAQFFVHHATEHDGDDIGSAAAENRIIGTIGLVGADMNLVSTTLTENQVQAITYYNLTF